MIDKQIILEGENKDNTVIDGSESGDVSYVCVNEMNISEFIITNCEKEDINSPLIPSILSMSIEKYPIHQSRGIKSNDA